MYQTLWQNTDLQNIHTQRFAIGQIYRATSKYNQKVVIPAYDMYGYRKSI